MMRAYLPPVTRVYNLEISSFLSSGSNQEQPPEEGVANEKLDFCLNIPDDKKDDLSARRMSIGTNEGIRMCVTLEDTLEYIYYIISKSSSQAILLACINEKGEFYDIFKDWSEKQLDVLSSSVPHLSSMILNGRALRGDRVGMIPVKDKFGNICDCAIRVIDFDWDTENHKEEMVRCHSIACQMLAEILSMFTEMDDGDISTEQKVKLTALELGESAKRVMKVARMLRIVDSITGI